MTFRSTCLKQHVSWERQDQRKSCSVQFGIKAGLRVDSAPQSNRGCRSPDPLHQISCSVFILVARSWTVKVTTGTQRGAEAKDLYECKWNYRDAEPGTSERPLKVSTGASVLLLSHPKSAFHVSGNRPMVSHPADPRDLCLSLPRSHGALAA